MIPIIVSIKHAVRKNIAKCEGKVSIPNFFVSFFLFESQVLILS